MRRGTVILVVLGLWLSFVPQAFSAKKKVVERIIPRVSVEGVQILAKQAQETLNQKSWTVNVLLQGQKRAKGFTDVLTFSGKSMVSQYLSSKGFGGSQYSLRIEPDKAAVFETVQRDAGDNIAMWRGELRGERLSGTLTIRYKDTGAVEVYSFSTISAEAQVMVP